MHRLKCSGWWEQPWFGRQPMENIELRFEDGQLSGRGTDMVGDFVFKGATTGERIYLLNTTAQGCYCVKR